MKPTPHPHQSHQHRAVQPPLRPPLGQHAVLEHGEHHSAVAYAFHLHRLRDRREATHQHQAPAVSEPELLVVAVAVVLLERVDQRGRRRKAWASEQPKKEQTGVEGRVEPFVLHIHAAHAVQRVHRLLDDLLDLLELRVEERGHVLHRFLLRVQDPDQIVAVLRRDRHARPVVVRRAVAAGEERAVRLHVGVHRVVEVPGPLVELADLEHIERLGERSASTLNAGRD